MEKEKVTLTGVNETLFVPLCARALETRKPDPAFRDLTAVRILDSVDYDASRLGGSDMNMWGCAARTIVFDEQARAYIAAHPDCSVVNIACGLDDRFSRVDNGRLHWYNIDMEDVIALRARLIPPPARVRDIACSAFDYRWMEEIENREEVLVLAEGFLMYVEEAQAKELFDRVAETFPKAVLLLELMTRWMVDHQQLHDTTKKAGVTFRWGVERTEDFTRLCPHYRLTGEYNFTDGMKRFAPVKMALMAPILRKKNNRVGRFDPISD